MSDEIVEKFFNKNTAENYDTRSQSVGAIMDNLHLLIGLVLKELPDDARILCVGVGTGADIIGLAHAFPSWRFTGVDPSEPMLDVCRARLQAENLAARCELIPGYLEDVPDAREFDAVLCLLVAHFLEAGAKRQALFDGMVRRLKPNGYLVNAEIGFDLASPQFDDIIDKWKAMHGAAGATAESLAAMQKLLRETITVLPPEQTEQLLRNSGLPLPIQFFQSLLIRAWYSRKPA